MIIVPTDKDTKAAETASPVGTVVDDPPDDPPPTYTALSPPGAVGETSAPPKLPPVKPSNYISIHRSNGSVKSAWVLDPSLTIPASLLPPLSPEETEETRRNFNLKATNGTIEADISFAPYDYTRESKQATRKRATLYINGSNGSITTKLHTPSAPRLPFYLNIFAQNGAVQLHIPRSFHGLLVIKAANGSTKFSPETTVHLTTFSEVDRTRRCFIGDYSELTDGEEWQGDEVVVEARNGGVKVQYDDEVLEKGERKSGFFGRLFGL
ncbi:hypothetical protein LshimejAT787_0601260 [Lyophyllum shimeji]|uniref:DUF7330 domain-containing protein n=1 Tax=Lyophyllum shimeji TaxID=47721 RepID=A0A9P3UL84_LYOSH|nr:hypothetical protein LshimejAT787_0601260 [Lyophyllum shimeji]